jgi:hypothetical protein
MLCHLVDGSLLEHGRQAFTTAYADIEGDDSALGERATCDWRIDSTAQR